MRLKQESQTQPVLHSLTSQVKIEVGARVILHNRFGLLYMSLNLEIAGGEARLRQLLLAWYDRQGRDLPWRRTRDAYKIWVSEVMLQQTQVKTAMPYYQGWMEKFPDLETLAAADLQDVLKAWEGLGYYSRARNLHAAARLLLSQHQGQIPQSLETLLQLPGIGRTTAGGILSAAFNLPVSILDGNVKRVLARLVALPIPPSKAMGQLWQLSDTLLDPDRPRDFNQGLMDLGATVCTPKNPACLLCPWQQFCQAYCRGIQDRIPMREASRKIPHKSIGVAVIWHEGKVLIDRRPQSGMLGGLWEFPGGKIEDNETVEACIVREIEEELAIAVEVGEHLITVEHAYTHLKVTLTVHHCHYLHGEPQPLACDEIRWVKPEELSQYPFPKANTKIVTALLDNL